MNSTYIKSSDFQDIETGLKKSTTDIDIDIENGLKTSLSNISLTVNNTNTNANTVNNKKYNIFFKNCGLKFVFWLVIMIVIFPIPFCDLYYGYTDNSCVNEHAGKLAINLKDYLLVYGYTIMSVLSFLSIGLCFTDIFDDGIKKPICLEYGECLIINGCFLIGIFINVWNIFGAIIFWGFMDINKCSNGTYNYVFTSLILKIISNVYFTLHRDNK